MALNDDSGSPDGSFQRSVEVGGDGTYDTTIGCSSCDQIQNSFNFIEVKMVCLKNLFNDSKT